jgi:hypothetical protein
MYDYESTTANLANYGAEVPPTYDFTSIDTPLYVFGAEKDKFSVPQDLDTFIQQLEAGGANLKLYKIVPIGHADFIWASNAYQDMYPELLGIVSSCLLQTPTLLERILN